MVYFLLCLFSILIAIIIAILFSPLLFELSGTWQEGQWQADFRLRSVFLKWEGRGCVSSRENNWTIKWGQIIICKRPLAIKPKKIESQAAEWLADIKKQGTLAKDDLTLYFEAVKKFLEQLYRPTLSLKGSYGFDDPSITGWAAGILYSIQVLLENSCSGIQWAFHPDFTGEPLNLCTCFAFTIRPYRLLAPSFWLTGRMAKKRWQQRQAATLINKGEYVHE